MEVDITINSGVHEAMERALDAAFPKRADLDVRPLVMFSPGTIITPFNELPKLNSKEYANGKCVLRLSRDDGELLLRENTCGCVPMRYSTRSGLLRILDDVFARYYVVYDIAPSIHAFLKSDKLLWTLRSDVVAVKDYVCFFKCVTIYNCL